MPYPVTSRLGRLGPRARAVTEAVEMTVRAEFAEALLTGEAPPPPPLPEGVRFEGKRPDSIVGVMMRMLPEMSGSQRKGLAKRLLRDGLMGGPQLSEKDQERLQRAVRPGDKQPMYLRLGLPDEIARILEPPHEKLDMEDHRDRRWLVDLAQEFWPGHEKTFDAMMHHDGRPPGSEPGEPEEPEEPGPGDPDVEDPDAGTPGFRTLRLVLERITCLQSTSGERDVDEISAGGVATDGPLVLDPAPQNANGEVFGPSGLGTYADGRNSTFDPLLLHEWDLDGVTLPHIFLGLFTLAEVDPGGGFTDYLNDLLASVETSIPALTQTATIIGYVSNSMYGFGLGFAYSVWVGGGPVGWIAVGIAVSVVSLVTMILSSLAGNMDDIFDLREMLLLLDQVALSGPPFFGQSVSRTLDFVIEGYGGRYEIFYHWELVDPLPVSPGDTDSGPPSLQPV